MGFSFRFFPLALVASGCLFLSMCFLFTSPALAQATALTIAPSVIKIRAQQPATVIAPFTLTNQTNDVATLQIVIRFFRATGDNQDKVAYLAQKPHFSSNINIFDGNRETTAVTLGPKEKRQLSLHIAIGKNEPPADYYFSVIFLSKPESEVLQNNQASLSILQTGIAMNVLLSIGPHTQEGYLEKFSTSYYIQSGPVPFTVRIANVGKQFITPHGSILITNMFGQKIGRVDLAPVSILAGTTRSIPDEVSYTDPDVVKNPAYQSLLKENSVSAVYAIWPETFLLGFYTATLYLSVASGRPVYVKTIHFVAFPLMFLVGTLIVLFCIALLIMRIRSRIAR